MAIDVKALKERAETLDALAAKHDGGDHYAKQVAGMSMPINTTTLLALLDLLAQAASALEASDKAMVAWGHEEDGLPEGHGIGAFEAHKQNKSALAALRAAGVEVKP